MSVYPIPIILIAVCVLNVPVAMLGSVLKGTSEGRAIGIFHLTKAVEVTFFSKTLDTKSLLNTAPSTYDRIAADIDFSFVMLELLCPISAGLFLYEQ